MSRKFTFTTQVYDERTDFPATGDVDVIYIDASKNTAYRYDVDYYAISSAEVNIWGALGSVSKGGGGGGASWGDITGTLSEQTDLQTALDTKQDDLTLTTTGTSGAATLVGSTLNIPQYSGGSGGLKGFHALIPLSSGSQSSSSTLGGNLSTGGGFTTNRLLAYPFIPNQSFTLSNLQINVTAGVAGSFCRIAVYTDLNGVPNTSMFISSDLDCSTVGLKTALTSISFVAGTTYWLAFHGGATSSSTTIIPSTQMIPLKSGGISVSNMLYKTLAFGGGTPSSFGGSILYSVSNVPLILITIA